MSSYVFSGFGGTVVPWASISTMQQVRDYAEAAVEASLSPCSSARAKYQEVLIKAEEALAEGNWDYNNPQKVSELRDSLDYAFAGVYFLKKKGKGGKAAPKKRARISRPKRRTRRTRRRR
jgi:hypothetical protein